MKLNYTFLTGLLLAGISLAFSATGLMHLFAGAAYSITVMAIAFELAKVTGTVWIMNSENRRGKRLLTAGLLSAILLLSGVSSLGIYGYLGRAFNQGRSEVVSTSTRTASLAATIARLEAQQDRLMKQIEAVPASQGTNRRLLTRTLQPQINSLEAQISARRDSLNASQSATSSAQNDIGELKFAAELLGTTQEGIAKVVITTLALLLDPLAVMLVMASGAKSRRDVYAEMTDRVAEAKEFAQRTGFTVLTGAQAPRKEVVYEMDLTGPRGDIRMVEEDVPVEPLGESIIEPVKRHDLRPRGLQAVLDRVRRGSKSRIIANPLHRPAPSS